MFDAECGYQSLSRGEGKETQPDGEKRRKLHEISLEEDIRYRGPLSYQGFMVLGWLCLVITTVHVPSVAGLIIAGEVVKDLCKNR